MVDKFSPTWEVPRPMARPLRILYPGAVYHAMNRGLARQPVFRTTADRRTFLTGLAAPGARAGSVRACGSGCARTAGCMRRVRP